MRKILILLFLPIVSYSQVDRGKEFNKLAVVHSFGSLEDGYSLGLLHEHQNKTVYYGSELYYFPKLNNYTYAHLIGRFGFNTFLDRYNTYRIYLGGRAGIIYRNNHLNNALLGYELGGDIFIYRNLFIGGYYSRDMKSDSKLWNKEKHFVNSVIFKLGITF